MLKPPRKSNRSIILSMSGIYILFFSVIQASIIIGTYLLGLALFDSVVARTMAFYAFNIIQILFIISARTDDSIFKNTIFKNKWLMLALGIDILIIVLIVLTPFKSVLHLVEINHIAWLICIGLPLLIMPVAELYKWVINKIFKKSERNR